MPDPSAEDAELKKLQSHPGYRYQHMILAHTVSRRILSANAFQLKTLLKYIEDSKNGLVIFNVENRKRSRELQHEVIRGLHNFVASTKTLVDHTRTLMGTDIIHREHKNEYQNEISRVFAEEPVVRFAHDMRNYMLHRTVPVTEIQVRFPSESKIDTTVRINLTEMEDWEGWTSISQLFVKKHKPSLRILDFIEHYEKVTADFYRWFYSKYEENYKQALAEFRVLVREYNTPETQ